MCIRDSGYSSHECILKNVNFSLDEPQVLSVLGANGAGKTTLLKCMLGLLEWNTGGTFVDGEYIPARIRSSVDFPAPFEPSRDRKSVV